LPSITSGARGKASTSTFLNPSARYRFATASYRIANRAALDDVIGSWTKDLEVETLEELLQSVGVPAHRLSNCGDVLDDPQLKARDHIIYLEHPQFGSVPYERSRMVFSRTPAAVGWPSAQIGQHNDYVLREILGLSTAEISALQTRKALE
jgi:formyl-CoA transferase